MTTQPHKVWRVTVASRDDQQEQSRRASLWNLPARAEYLIEAKGQGARAKAKAILLAREEGITQPVVVGVECLS